MSRLFVAINLSEQIKKALSGLQKQFTLSTQAVKWVEQQNFHLTLKFLGETPRDIVPLMEKGLSLVASTHGPGRLVLRGLGAFPSTKRPKVLWVGVMEEGIREVQQAMERELAVLGFPPEKRDFSPHLTLGRIREGFGVEGSKILTLLQSSDGIVGTVNVNSIDLMESKLTPAGPVYTCLREFLLSGGNI